VIVVTTFEGDYEIQRALTGGAFGYVLKSAPLDELVGVIRKVHAGRKHLPAVVAENLAVYVGGDPLTEREVEVLRRVAEGDRNRDIGKHLGIAEDTVKVHVKRIMDKLAAKDRTQAVAIGIRRGIITL
jgi:DNA-binding NarL/FixJ family response regulator